MKKALAMVLALVMCLGLVACAGSGSNSTPATTKASTDTQAPAADGSGKAAEGKTMLYYTAYIGDFGLADMGWRAAQAAQEKYGYDVTLVEYGNDSSQAVNSLIDALDTKHYDYVMAMGWYISDTVIEKSKTGKVGCVINLDAPITNDFGTGWLCGVKYAKKTLGLNVDSMYTYMGELTVQGDYESVNVVMDNGCDYVYNVGASVSLGAMQAADEKGGYENGKFIIGTDYDQYTYFETVGDVQGYKSMVTSMLKNIEPCVALLMQNINGEATGIEPGNHTYGVAEGGTGLAENDWYKQNTPEDVQKQIADISAKIASGEIDVVSYFDFPAYDDFATYRDNIDAEFTK